ncbi:MAG: MFS transporter [Phycisphaerales bacterium]|nr:MFS transporter [Phycisphaerales bacterium]
MDRACIASAVDAIKRDLSVSGEMMGLILGIFAVGYALFQVPSGWFADRLGPRWALTVVVSVWSVFTVLTGAARTALQLLVLRFFFGVGEAGAFPGAAQAFFRWLPVKERGLAYGINFSGGRVGAAFSLFLMPWLISQIGWRWTFVANGLVGVVWATLWLLWFRDNPRDNRRVNQAELEYIEQGRVADFAAATKTSFAEVFTSLNMFLTMLQYFASNVTFFISLTWLPSYLQNQWPQDPRAVYWSSLPLICAASANWVAGAMVTKLYQYGYHVGSRRVTAIVGFSLGVIGLLLATQTDNLYMFIIFFSLATFGVDMTLSPSWSFCNDIGGGNSGAVSGSMNMAGNIGAALSAILFPVFQDSQTGNANAFFFIAAALNLVAIAAWLVMNPNRRSDRQLSPAAIRRRFVALMTFLLLLAGGAVGYQIYRSTRKTAAPDHASPSPVISENVGIESLSDR